MRQSWQQFIHRTLAGVPDDPHVRLLRERLRSGSSVVRVHLEGPAARPEYRLLLSRNRELSEMRVPHSESFTRWSLEQGVRLATPEEEAQRFALLLRERLQPLEQEWGQDFEPILIEHLKVLGPPQAQATLAGRQVRRLAEGRSRLKVQVAVESVLASLVQDLGSSLRYSEPQVAELADAALEHYLSERFHLGEQVPQQS